MEVRKRRMQGSPISSQPHKAGDKEHDKRSDENYSVTELRGSFWLTRIVFIRSLGSVYCKRLQLRNDY